MRKALPKLGLQQFRLIQCYGMSLEPRPFNSLWHHHCRSTKEIFLLSSYLLFSCFDFLAAENLIRIFFGCCRWSPIVRNDSDQKIIDTYFLVEQNFNLLNLLLAIRVPFSLYLSLSLSLSHSCTLALSLTPSFALCLALILNHGTLSHFLRFRLNLENFI